MEKKIETIFISITSLVMTSITKQELLQTTLTSILSSSDELLSQQKLLKCLKQIGCEVTGHGILHDRDTIVIEVLVKTLDTFVTDALIACKHLQKASHMYIEVQQDDLVPH